jgi:thiol-disulfide isomerase/thioredoxin
MSSTLKTVQRCASRWIAVAGVLLAAAPVAHAQELPKNLIVNELPQPVGGLRFDDGRSQTQSLADFHGKVVLLNIWATWCTPCRKELPALEHLGAALDGAEFAILAVSIDRGGIEAVRKLFGQLSIETLPIYIDTSGRAMRAARVNALPTSLIIDRDGREVARIVGPVDWDAVATIDYFRRVVARGENDNNGQFDHGGMAGDVSRPRDLSPRADRITFGPRSNQPVASAP